MKNQIPSKGNSPRKFFNFLCKYSSTMALLILLAIFFAYSIFLATNLQTGRIPDETYRFEVSTYFVETWGIPEYVPIAYTSGDNLHRNPFLGYWLYGRALSLYQLLNPNSSEWQNLVVLRIFNSLFALGTVLVTFFLSKELLNNKWWQLLPVFFITNTLMFVFLSGGVNYDNPTNFFSALGFLFLIRVFNHKHFINNSLGWLISILTATLIKFSILPLALAMAVAWLIYLIRNKKNIVFHSKSKQSIFWLSSLLVIIIAINFSIYGVNILKFQSLTPSCQDTFPIDVCEESFFGQRHARLALPEKLTVISAFRQGYPEPIRYIFDEWIRAMLDRTFGIMGEKNYFPINVAYFHIAFYWLIILGARYIKTLPFKWISLLSITIFYALVLVWMNYNTELAYGFNTYVALQGRYIFPVISVIYVFCTFILLKVTNKWVKYSTILLMILLFFYSGPIRFIWYYQSVFADWFI